MYCNLNTGGCIVSQISVKINEDVKEKAVEILHDIGMTSTQAVNIRFRKIIKTGGFPLDLKGSK